MIEGLKRWWYRSYGIHVRFNDPDWTWPTVNAGMLRLIEQHWNRIATSRGVYDWTQMDQIMAVAASRYEVIYNLFGTPRWASQRPDESWQGQPWTLGRMAPPVDLQDLADFLDALMTRYPGIRYFEGWNEPFDAPHHWTGTVDELVAIQRVLYETVKRRNLKAVVLSPPCGSTPTAFALLDEFVGKAKDYFDVMAHHFYAPTFRHRARDVYTVRGMMAFHGIEGRELWNTETGFDFSSVAVEDQAALVVTMFEQMRALGVKRSVFFIWNDPEGRMGIDKNPAIVAAWNGM